MENLYLFSKDITHAVKVSVTLAICLLLFGFGQVALGQITTTVNGGAGASYTSLTGAAGLFNAINTGSITGNIVATIVTDITETRAVPLTGPTLGFTGTLLIQSDGITPCILSAATTFVNPLIDIQGVSHVTIDGGSNKLLTFQHADVSGGPVIQFSLNSTNGLITNCNIQSNSGSSAKGQITIGPSTTDAVSVIISNNEISNIQSVSGLPETSIYSNSTSNTINVINNNIYNFQVTGIDYVRINNGCIISGNSFFTELGVPALSTQVAISVGAGNNHSINNNFIGGQSPKCGGSPMNTLNLTGITVDCNSTNPVIIQGNTIQNISASGGSGTFKGIGITSGLVKIRKNKIFNCVATNSNKGIQIENNTSINEISNNMISLGGGSSEIYGIRIISTGGTFDFFYNSIYIYGNELANNLSYAFAVDGATTCFVNDNIFLNERTTSGTLKQSAILFITGSIVHSDYNDLYVTPVTGSSVLGNWHGSPQADFAAWKASSGGDGNSFNVLPVFVNSATNLHIISNATLANKGIPVSVPDDIDGLLRTGQSNVGINQFGLQVLVGIGQTYHSLTETGVSGLFAALNPNTLGNITAIIKSDIAETGVVSLNNTYTGTLMIQTDNVTNRILHGPTLNPNFPVIDPMININGADNVTFDGTGNGLTFINYDLSNGATTGPVIQFTNGSLLGTITNCTIESNSQKLDGGEITIGSGINSVSITNSAIFDGSQNVDIAKPRIAIYSNSLNNKITITNNIICNWQDFGINLALVADSSYISGNSLYNEFGVLSAYPQSAIYVNGGLGHSIMGNFIGGQNPNCGDLGFPWITPSLKGITLDGTASSVSSTIQGNAIQNIKSSGIFRGIQNIKGVTTARKNRIYNIDAALETVGISNEQALGANEFSNNMISIGGAGDPIYGFKDNSTLGGTTDFFYNSINIYGVASGSNSSSAFYRTGTSTYNVKDNILFNKTLGSTHYAIFVNPTTGFISSNFNDLFVNGSVLGFWGAAPQANLTPAWQTSSSLDANSVSVAPGFLSDFDLLPNSNVSNGTAVSVLDDIESIIRGIPTGIGIYKFTVSITPFNVTGGGSYCSGGAGQEVKLDHSQTNVTYTLFKNGVPQSPTVAGNTPNPITFGFQPLGTYTVIGSITSGSNSGTVAMLGNAVITAFTTWSTVTAAPHSWNVAVNWCSGVIPFSTDDVIIGGGPAPVIFPGATALCNNLFINSGTVLTIAPLGKLSVNGAVSNSNSGPAPGITIQSDATGTGSMIILAGADAGLVSAERYMTTGAWHMVSSPLSGLPVQSVDNFLSTNPNIPTSTIYRGMMDYNPAPNVWNTFYTTTPTPIGNLEIGKGFSMRVGAINDKVTFAGGLQTGTLTVPAISSFWNCIGNPYTSAITINTASGSNNFLNANIANLDPSFVAIYVWDQPDSQNELPNNYTVINNVSAAFEAQQAQGYFVKMKTGISTVSFTSLMQIHNPALALKSSKIAWPSIKLEATVGIQNSSTLIAFNSAMTKGLDPSYDAGLFKAASDLLVYSKLVEDNGIPFAIQALPDNDFSNMIIPIGLDFKTGGEVVFSSKLVNLPSDCKVILEDMLAKTFTDLSSNVYKVTIAANSVITDRFRLKLSSTTTGLDKEPVAGKLNAYAVSNVQIRVTGEVSKNAVATLYDVHGRIVLVKKLQAGTENSFPLPNIKIGIYMLSVNDNGKLTGFKILVRE